VIRTTTMPLNRIAGVGLLFRRSAFGSRAPEGWFLTVWQEDGQRIQLKKFLVTAWRTPKPPPGQKRPIVAFGRDPARPLPHENVQELASTHPGRIALEMYEWILGVQGESGPLATEQLQKTATFDQKSAVETWAWWSPDGTMERLRK
jgi:hypothetical protein